MLINNIYDDVNNDKEDERDCHIDVIIVILVKGQCSLSVAALTTAFAVFQKTRPGVRMTVMVMILMLMRISTK